MTHDGWMAVKCTVQYVGQDDRYGNSSFSSVRVIRIRRLRLSGKLVGRNQGSASLSYNPNMRL